MTKTAPVLIFLLSLSAISRGQTEIDGHTAFFDAGTDTYLVSVPEGYAPGIVPDSVSVDYTHLPILKLSGEFGNDYAEGTLTVSLPSSATTEYRMKAKYRGGITNHADCHKHNFHLKLLDEKGNSLDKSLLGMRKDDNWLLDAGQIDLGRIRNHVAHEIWRDMGNVPYYADMQPEARSYIGAEFAELFINDEYFGLYSLCEAMDRKQMQLEKYDDYSKEIRGMLVKGTSYVYTDMYGPFDEADDYSATWGGFKMKYPDLEDVCPTNWEPFYNAVTFVDESGASEFADRAGEYFDIPAFVSLFVFHTVLAATDHAGKNLVYACRDVREGEPPMFTPAAWDYDTTLGQTAQNTYVHSDMYGPEMGDYMRFANSLGTKLLYRLAKENACGFVEKTLERYWELRPTVFSEDSLTFRYNNCFDTLRSCGTLARETARWSGDTDIREMALDFDYEQEYIDGYIRRRLEYLDGVFTPEAAEKAILASAGRNPDAGGSGEKAPVYNIYGQRVDESYKGIVISDDGRKIIAR